MANTTRGSGADQRPQKTRHEDRYDAVIVGAGLAGLYMLYRLRALGLKTRVFEAGSGVGGTWFWNRYPGARCDVESMDYSYSFSEELQQTWHWSERYATQPEILRYINHVADRFDLWPAIQLETRVIAAHYAAKQRRWVITTDGGATVAAKYCIMATGCLSSTQVPSFSGLASFEGQWYHTGNWPHQAVDFTGQRVGIIGTGSSAIQSIPVIAQQAAHLYVFQRTPNFSLPARNAPLDPEYERWLKAHYAEHRRKARQTRAGFIVPINDVSALAVIPEERLREYESRWSRGGFSFMSSFKDLGTNKAANDTAAEFVRAKIRALVHDPAVAEALLPHDHPIGTKRICLDSHYFETYNRPNVSLVNLRQTPLETITPTGLRTTEREYQLDSLVLATGFDAMTGALFAIDIRGRAGRSLKRQWAHGPRAYLGLAIAGFPNLFLITGPGSPSVLSNMIVSIEHHVDWIAKAITYLHTHDYIGLEATPEAEAAWVEHTYEVAQTTLYPLANSWYLGSNIPGKPRTFMPYAGGVGVYQQRCAEIAAQGYVGFRLLRRRPESAAAAGS